MKIDKVLKYVGELLENEDLREIRIIRLDGGDGWLVRGETGKVFQSRPLKGSGESTIV